MPYIKPFYIAVNPVGSKFAKALQQELRNRVQNKVLRAMPQRVAFKAQRLARKYFCVTTQPLDKIQQLTRFKDANVSHPAWTTDAGQVGQLGSRHAFARTLVNSTNGRGIIEFALGDLPPPAPLYTAYIPKKAEYRVHVFNQEVIDVQQKKKKGGRDDHDHRVRNLHNGYVYCRDAINPPAGMHQLAVDAVRCLGYLYGAVDIIYNEKRNQCYVLEVNSRPGLMGTTVQKYAEAIIKANDLRIK
jgi:hypothetical protein